MAVVLHSHGFHHRAAQLCAEFGNIDHQATVAGHVGHVQRHDDGQAQTLQLQYQAQVHAQVGGVHYRHNGVDRGLALAPAFDDLQRHFFVGRGRMQAVDAGQVDDGHRAATGQAHQANLAFHSHAGVVGDFLPRAGQ